jgi:hypothetical protein
VDLSRPGAVSATGSASTDKEKEQDAVTEIGTIVQKLELDPDDILLVRVSQPVTEEMAKRLKEHFRNAIPLPTKILIIDSQLDITKLKPSKEGVHDMRAQEILEGIARHRANPVQYNVPSGELIASDVTRKIDEIEWALQALAELLRDQEQQIIDVVIDVHKQTDALNEMRKK